VVHRQRERRRADGASARRFHPGRHPLHGFRRFRCVEPCSDTLPSPAKRARLGTEMGRAPPRLVDPTVGLGSRDLATVDRNLHHLRDNPELIARTALVVEQVVVNPEGRNDDIVLCRESLCEFGSGEIVVSGHGLPFASNRRDRLHRLHHGLGSAAIDHPPRMI